MSERTFHLLLLFHVVMRRFKKAHRDTNVTFVDRILQVSTSRAEEKEAT